MFITLEGMDGSGKTTVLKPLQAFLEEQGYQVLVTREPGGTTISEEIRNVVLHNRKEIMDPWTEALLFIASRKQHLKEVIIPALEQGYIVLCDRYMDSTTAYQGAGRGLKIDEIDEVQRIVLGDWIPDLTLYFDVDSQVANERLNQRDEVKNRLDNEKQNYKENVFQGYQTLIKKYPSRFSVIDANLSKEDVLEQTKEILKQRLNYGKK